MYDLLQVAAAAVTQLTGKANPWTDTKFGVPLMVALINAYAPQATPSDDPVELDTDQFNTLINATLRAR